MALTMRSTLRTAGRGDRRPTTLATVAALALLVGAQPSAAHARPLPPHGAVSISPTASVTRSAASPGAPAAPAATSALPTRSVVIRNYQERLEPLLDVAVGWTGSLATCRAGSTSPASMRATLDAVNYVRSLAGLPAVRLDPVKSAKAQASALIQAANGHLSHSPAASSRCWTRAGATGAAHSNLFLWQTAPRTLSPGTGPRAIVGYLRDGGSGNLLVGHRRWILYQQLSTIGNGDTDRSNSLYVIPDTYLGQRGTRWISWPTAGYFPRQLEPSGRWSLSYPTADFTRARITVTTPNGKVATLTAPVAVGYGDNTLAWDMTLPSLNRLLKIQAFFENSLGDYFREPSSDSLIHA